VLLLFRGKVNGVNFFLCWINILGEKSDAILWKSRKKSETNALNVEDRCGFLRGVAFKSVMNVANGLLAALNEWNELVSFL